ncbi:hypothetical protein P7H17_02165 [Paenibacillus larvae]|nr:hypothetical protein [Paenibacillus larvae]MDT2285151.1 hypothetical protein [Paenibacillus larvae]
MENRLSEIAGIKEAVVTVRGGREDREVPVCLCNGEEKIDTEKVKQELGRSPAGLRYRACGGDGEAAADEERESRPAARLPAPEKQGEGSVSYEAPVSGIEKKLAEIWGEVLDIDRVGVNDNFF